ncbi:uncharacterized protein PSFLO_06557 [Pseudozyma flocculosa]|nr:uncharacterized protein PSFLO_06557 [Pseudozyma flocculosa]
MSRTAFLTAQLLVSCEWTMPPHPTGDLAAFQGPRSRLLGMLLQACLLASRSATNVPTRTSLVVDLADAPHHLLRHGDRGGSRHGDHDLDQCHCCCYHGDNDGDNDDDNNDDDDMPTTPLLADPAAPGRRGTATSSIESSVVVYNRTSLAVQVSASADGDESRTATTARPRQKVSIPAVLDIAAAGRAALRLVLQAGSQRFAASVFTSSRVRTAAAAAAAADAKDVGQGGAAGDSPSWSLLSLGPVDVVEKGVARSPPFLAYASSPSPSQPFSLLLLPSADLCNFLARLPSSLLLSALTLPGTHESAARYGWPISTCQSSAYTIREQLQRGIRFLDIRLSLKGGRLLAYHGVSDQKIDFASILDDTYAFLEANAGETVVMSVKQENDLPGFKETVLRDHLGLEDDNERRTGADRRWYLDARIPTLGEVRGKVVLISRFGTSREQPGGIHPPIWPNSSPLSFRYTLPSGQVVETQDWYDIGSLALVPTKMQRIWDLLQSSGRSDDVWSLNFTSASSFPLALPPFVATGWREGASTVRCASVQGVNARLLDGLCQAFCAELDSEGGRGDGGMGMGMGMGMGWKATFALDYFHHPPGLVEALVAANFR